MFPSRCAGIEYFLLKLAPGLTDMDLVINIRDYPQSSKYFGDPLPIFSFSKVNIIVQISFLNYLELLFYKLIQFINNLSIIKFIYRLHNIMILHIQHGHFGKVDLQFLCILVVLEDGMNIVYL